MQPQQIVLFVVLFVAVAAACAAAASLLLSHSSEERARLRAVTRGKGARPGGEDGSMDLTDSAAHPTIERMARAVRQSPKRTGRVRRNMVAAGYRSMSAVALFTVIEVVVAAVFGIATIAVLGARGAPAALLLAAVGFMTPQLVLAKFVRRRQRAIQQGLPDTLDLLTICLEAGCTLDQAIVRAADQLKLAHREVAEELALVRAELQAGRSKADVLRSFADRTQVDDVRSLAAMLLQTDRFGTSIAQALRTHGESLRSKRRLQAEERAAKAGVKLVFPLVFCFFPGFYVVVLGPSVIQFVRVFFEDLKFPH